MMSLVARRGRTIGAAAATVAVIAGGAWLVLGRDDGGSTPPAPNLTARVDQFRTDEPIHQLRATFANNEPDPVFVETLQFVSPNFEVLPPVRQDYELPAGGTVEVSLRTKYGPAICNGEIPTVAEPARAVVRIRTANGSSGEYGYPLSDKHDLLGKLLRDDCETQKIESSVQIRYGDTWELTTTDDGDPAIRNLLSLQLADADAEVEIVRMRGSVLYDITASGEPIARLDNATPQIDAPLVFTKNNRCDPHALTGSQQSYVFMVWISVDDSDPISMILVPDRAGQEALTQLIALVCNPG